MYIYAYKTHICVDGCMHAYNDHIDTITEIMFL